MSSDRLTVEVQDLAREPDTPADEQIERWIRAAAAPAAVGEITVRIVGEPESAALNETYRGRRGATNVLAFPAGTALPEEIDELLPIGDLVICAPVLAREAASQGKPLAAHWAHIVIHGCLHLFGYDHATDGEALVMENRERELLAEFRISDPYATLD